MTSQVDAYKVGRSKLALCLTQSDYCCDQTTTGSDLVRKGFILLTFPHHGFSSKAGQELQQGRNPETGSDAEAMEEYDLLPCSSWLD